MLGQYQFPQKLPNLEWLLCTTPPACAGLLIVAHSDSPCQGLSDEHPTFTIGAVIHYWCPKCLGMEHECLGLEHWCLLMDHGMSSNGTCFVLKWNLNCLEMEQNCLEMEHGMSWHGSQNVLVWITKCLNLEHMCLTLERCMSVLVWIMHVL